jgi:hypothetical protein
MVDRLVFIGPVSVTNESKVVKVELATYGFEKLLYDTRISIGNYLKKLRIKTFDPLSSGNLKILTQFVG